MKDKRSAKSHGTAFFMEELEPRILMSASLEGLLMDDSSFELSENNYTEAPEQLVIIEDEYFITSEVDDNIRRELVIINPDTPDFQILVDDLISQQSNERQFDVLLLDINKNGIEQITIALNNYQNLDAVHLVSHGSNGSIQLGDNSLSYDNIGAYSNDIASWNTALSQDADFLIYGCELASDNEGLNLIDSLSVLTGADIAASDDLTGAENLGSDWDLEYKQGNIETNTAFSPDAQQNWNQVLASWTVNSTLTDVNNTVITNEDSTYVFSLTDFNFSNINSNNLEHIFITDLGNVGSLQLSGVDVSLYQDITAAQISAGNLVFTPTVNANGINYSHFGFLVYDGSAYSDNAYTLTINVDSVNDKLVVMNNTLTIKEDTSTTINIATLISYGSDLDGDILTLASFTQPDQGTLTDNGDGTLRYVPKSDYNGEDHFTYTLSDGQGGSVIATMSLDITPVEDLIITADVLNSTNSTNDVSEPETTLSEESVAGLIQNIQQQNHPETTVTNESQTQTTPEQIIKTHVDEEEVNVIAASGNDTNEANEEEQTEQQELENENTDYYWDDQPVVSQQEDADRSQFTKIKPSLANEFNVTGIATEFLAITSRSENNTTNINIYNHDYNTHSPYINDAALWNALDEMAIAMSNTTDLNQREELIVGVATGAAWSVSAGIVASSLRSGSLIASLMASVPLWNWFDPLPVLSISAGELIEQQKKYNNEADKENQKYRFLKKIIG